ncbi:hypothetical protein R50073_29120 [Maricurvus nonylphenolicus]|uniref:twin-arginine translocation signal domain-containing protein n=1 Tax=Maricurvus nonylphenolicus TaxID=1008307 RepID=UPI0036F2BB1A
MNNKKIRDGVSPPGDQSSPLDESNISSEAVSKERRNFLVRSGLAGVAAAITPSLLMHSPKADAALLASSDIIEQVLAALTKDTMAGVVSFMVPGNDLHSIGQGEFYLFQKGGMAADTDDFLVEGFNQYMEMPESLSADLFTAVTKSYSDAAGPLPAAAAALLAPLEQWVMNRLEAHIEQYLEDTSHIPLAGIFAMLLNVLASTVNPWATGVQLSPFARLSWEEKARVFEKFETELPDLLAEIAANLSGEMNDSISGLISFAAGAIMQFAAFGSYSEWQVYDTESKQLTYRPVGWDLSNYLPHGPVEGWDDFIGYYQGRSEVDA